MYPREIETICMKCQSLFPEKNEKNINLSCAELAQRVVKVDRNAVALLLIRGVNHKYRFLIAYVLIVKFKISLYIIAYLILTGYCCMYQRTAQPDQTA